MVIVDQIYTLNLPDRTPQAIKTILFENDTAFVDDYHKNAALLKKQREERKITQLLASKDDSARRALEKSEFQLELGDEMEPITIKTVGDKHLQDARMQFLTEKVFEYQARVMKQMENPKNTPMNCIYGKDGYKMQMMQLFVLDGGSFDPRAFLETLHDVGVGSVIMRDEETISAALDEVRHRIMKGPAKYTPTEPKMTAQAFLSLAKRNYGTFR